MDGLPSGVGLLNHIDLFSGIGGFALACDWAGVQNIGFVEIDPFCRQILNKHWPGVPVVKDVNNVEEVIKIVADAQGGDAGRGPREVPGEDEPGETRRPEGRGGKPRNPNRVRRVAPDPRLLGSAERELPTAGIKQRGQTLTNPGRISIGSDEEAEETRAWRSRSNHGLILTAGFPCQPFSNAGRKRGTADDRYLWPQTLAVIEALRPDDVVLENVAGLLNMVLPDSETSVAEQTSLWKGEADRIADFDTLTGIIDRDLRTAGYETVWLVIPACSLGAPHRRDRVWVVAHYAAGIRHGEENQISTGRNGSISANGGIITNSGQQGLQGSESRQSERLSGQSDRIGGHERPSWQENWYEVATRLCTLDDGLSPGLVRPPKWRENALKGAGNAIVPQVAYQIIKTIVEIGEGR